MFRHKRWLFAFIPLCILLGAALYRAPALAAPVDTFLDPDFGVDGQTITRFSDGMGAYSMVLQNDGRILVAGGYRNFDLARYTPDGRLDPSFGDQGQVSTSLSSYEEVAQALVRQADGQLTLAGYVRSAGTGRDFTLVRYNAAGQLDPSFGTGGHIFTNFDGFDDQANALVQQADGKMLAAGSATLVCGYLCTRPAFALARYNLDGTLDTSFGLTGTVTTVISGTPALINALAVQPDGKIVVAGAAGSTAHFALARYTPDGSLDPTFGSGGLVQTSFSGQSGGAQALTILADGRLLVAGGATSGFSLARYQANGSLDPTFGSGGTEVDPLGAQASSAYALTVDPAGRIILAGGGPDLVLARYLPDGGLDPNFGVGGGGGAARV